MSDTTALAPINERFLALSDSEQAEDLREAMEANMSGGSIRVNDLPTVKVPAQGSTTWIIPGLAGEEATPALEGILVAIGPVTSTIWESRTPSEGSLPVAVSRDGVTFRQVADEIPEEMQVHFAEARNEDGTFDAEQLYYNQYGSGINDKGQPTKGKWANDGRDLFLLRADDAFPIVVHVPATSLKPISTFLKDLGFGGVPHYRAVVSLSLAADKSKGGQKYSVIVPALIEKLDRDTGKSVKSLFTEPCTTILAGS